MGFGLCHGKYHENEFLKADKTRPPECAQGSSSAAVISTIYLLITIHTLDDMPRTRAPYPPQARLDARGKNGTRQRQS
eukprot:6209065-Pleurochrysis_carterae.AAC.1